jgi:hypothetical protein
MAMVEVLELEALESLSDSLCDLFYMERSASTTPAIKISVVQSVRHDRRLKKLLSYAP